MSADLQRLQAAYRAWHETKGADSNVWLDLMAEDVAVRSIGEEPKGLEFAKDRVSREDAVGYLAGIVEHWSMIHWTPETFVCDEDRIAVFGRCAWTNKNTGKSAEALTAHLWRFRDGKVVEFTEIFDTARAAAAAAED